MSYSYDRIETQRRRQTYGASSRRTTFGYWVPLVVTVTAATIGLAAWIWKERRDEEDYDRDGKDYRPPPSYGEPPPGQSPYPPGQSSYPPGGQPIPPETQPIPREDPGLMARMSGALRRTPSPQQFFDEAGRRVSAGVAMAGTAVAGAVGGTLGSIREEDRTQYEDHSRWSEDAAVRASSNIGSTGPLGAPQLPIARSGDRRKTVAIVVSAQESDDGVVHDASYFQEHASILSHLPEHIDDESRVFIMIYAPDLKQHPLASSPSSQPATSLASSYSNIGHEDVQESTGLDPLRTPQAQSRMFSALYAQAQALVEKQTMIMPFTTPGGYVHLLRHIAPEVVYVQSTLAGENGDAVKHISGWVGQVVLVVGDESGHGGLVDSEDERVTGGDHSESSKWWQDDPSIGLGKGIEVVEGMRVGEDWRRRVRGHD